MGSIDANACRSGTKLLYKGDLARSTYRFDLYPQASRAYMEKVLEFLQIYL